MEFTLIEIISALLIGFALGLILMAMLSASSPKENEKLIYDNRILSEKLKVAENKNFDLMQYLIINKKDIEEKDGIIADLRKEINALTTEKEFAKNHKRGFIKLDTEV
jgi:hypothetical protein